MSAGNQGDTSGRRRTARWLLAAAVVLAVLALALSYLGRAVLRSGPFADRAVATLRDAAVRDDVADHVTDVGGLTLVVLLTVGREIAVQLAPAGRGATVGVVWTAFLGGLRVQALLLAGVGAICAGVASGQLGRAGSETRRTRGWVLRTGAGNHSRLAWSGRSV